MQLLAGTGVIGRVVGPRRAAKDVRYFFLSIISFYGLVLAIVLLAED